jgi:hypothetical protein
MTQAKRTSDLELSCQCFESTTQLELARLTSDSDSALLEQSMSPRAATPSETVAQPEIDSNV